MDALAAVQVKDLTAPRATGRPVNGHVVAPQRQASPDYERMKNLVHNQNPVDKTNLEPAV